MVKTRHSGDVEEGDEGEFLSIHGHRTRRGALVEPQVNVSVGNRLVAA